MRGVRFLVALLLLCACSSSSPSSGSLSPDGGSAACPDVAGTWNITAHCDASLIGQSVAVTQTDCTLSFAAPFDGFTGTVTNDGMLSLRAASRGLISILSYEFQGYQQAYLFFHQ